MNEAKMWILIFVIVVALVQVLNIIHEIKMLRRTEKRLSELQREYAAKVLYNSTNHYCDRCRYWEELRDEGVCSECSGLNDKWQISKQYARELAEKMELK